MVDFTSIGRLVKKAYGVPSGPPARATSAGIGYDPNGPGDYETGGGGGHTAGHAGSGFLNRWGPTLGGGGAGSFEEEEAMGIWEFWTRIAQIFFVLIALFVLIAIAVFQTHWGVGPSGLTGFGLFVVIVSILHSAFSLAVPVIYERTDFKRLKGLNRALGEARVGFLSHGISVALLLIAAMANTISAFTSPGCKDASKDPHASIGDNFKNALPDFCRDKRALSAFFWFALIASLILSAFFLRDHFRTRKQGPRIPPFRAPSNASAFAPVRTGEEWEEGDDADPYSRRSGAEGGPRSSKAYGEGGLGYSGDAEGGDPNPVSMPAPEPADLREPVGRPPHAAPGPGPAQGSTPVPYGAARYRPAGGGGVYGVEAGGGGVYGAEEDALAALERKYGRRISQDPFADGAAAAAAPRPSMDAYGAFSDAAPSGYGVGSVTRPPVTDPYADIRRQLYPSGPSPGATQPSPSQPQSIQPPAPAGAPPLFETVPTGYPSSAYETGNMGRGPPQLPKLEYGGGY